MDLGALFAMIGLKPEMAGQLDALGIPAPNPMMVGMGGKEDLGGLIGGGAVGGQMGGGMLAAPAIGPWETTVTPTGADGPSMGQKLLAGMQGIKAPEAPKPIMGGGVTGGVRAPEMNAQAATGGGPVLAALMQAMLSGGGQNPLRVPELGSFIRGGRY